MSHTPGPWEVAIPGEVDEHYAVLDGFGHTASVYGHPEQTSTALANAHLIAAAPDLLAALRDCRDWLVAICDSNNLEATERGYLEAATAAIEKAEGRRA